MEHVLAAAVARAAAPFLAGIAVASIAHQKNLGLALLMGRKRNEPQSRKKAARS
jgi:cytochrome b